MSDTQIQPGTYNATPIYGIIGESRKKKTPQAAVQLKFTQGEQEHVLWWIGYFTEATKKRTIEALTYMGFTSDDEFGEGKLSNPQEVEIVIKLEPISEETDAKLAPKIAWVNQLGASKFASVEKSEIKRTIGLDLNKELKAARAELGMKPITKTETTKTGGGKATPF